MQYQMIKKNWTKKDLREKSNATESVKYKLATMRKEENNGISNLNYVR
jgi:hypothetical protein